MNSQEFNATAKECLAILGNHKITNLNKVQEKLTKMRDFSIEEMTNIDFNSDIDLNLIKGINMRIEILKSLDKKIDDVYLLKRYDEFTVGS